MASQPVIEIEALLAPVSDEQPTGEEFNAKQSGNPVNEVCELADDAREAEKAAIRAMRSGGLDSQGQPILVDAAKWAPVLEAATSTLTSQSKDWHVAVSLTDALLREHGIGGLRDGFQFMMELCRRYWEVGIHPKPDIDPDPDTGTGHYEAMRGFANLTSDVCFRAIRKAPITESTSFSAEDFEKAKRLTETSDAEERERLTNQGAVELPAFMSAVMNSSIEFFRNLREDLDQAANVIYELEEFLDGNCVADAEEEQPTSPSLVDLRRQIEALQAVVNELAAERGIDDELPSEEGGEGEEAAGGGGPSQPSGAITSREEAFQLITRVARFFETTEPQSLIACLLRQTVEWGKMPIADLWREVIQDDSVRNVFERFVTPNEEE